MADDICRNRQGDRCICTALFGFELPLGVRLSTRMYLVSLTWLKCDVWRNCLRSDCSGIGKEKIQIIKADPVNQERYPWFQNKAPLRPVTATQPIERNQVDLVRLAGHPLAKNGVTYKYVMVLVDVFSRYVWLQTLPHKDAGTVAENLMSIWDEVGTPVTVRSCRVIRYVFCIEINLSSILKCHPCVIPLAMHFHWPVETGNRIPGCSNSYV